MSDGTADLRVSLTTAIEGWERAERELDSKISGLVVEKDSFSKQIAAARLILGNLSAEAGSPEATAPVRKPPVASPHRTPKPPRLTVTKQWQDVILSIVERYPLGCTYPELREGISRSLSPEIAEKKKSYERAMSILAGERLIERGYGRVFTPKGFEAFKREIDAGRESPVVAQPFARSPMGEAILAIVHRSPGLKGKQIIAELRRDPEFNAALTPHETGAFNIIARLSRRHQILKRDDGGCYPGRAFPHDLLGLPPRGVEAPNGNAAGTSFAGGAATSPIESQPALRLIS